MRLAIVVLAGIFLFSCSTQSQRVNAKAAWYDVITSYELRVDRCLVFDENNEPVEYNPELPGCEVTPDEARKAEGLIISYNEAAKLFADDPTKSACSMVKAVNELVIFTDSEFRNNFTTPLIDAYCGDSVINEIDMIIAAENAADSLERNPE